MESTIPLLAVGGFVGFAGGMLTLDQITERLSNLPDLATGCRIGLATLAGALLACGAFAPIFTQPEMSGGLFGAGFGIAIAGLIHAASEP